MSLESAKHVTPKRIVVLVYIVRCPLGGMAWHYLQYAMGLKRLGHDVLVLEDSEDYGCCYDPARHLTDADPAYGLRFADSVFKKTGLGDQWVYHDAHKNQWYGPRADSAIQFCQSADLLINISGANPIRPWLESIPRRAFIDTDPVFEQVRQLTVQHRRERADQHNVFFSFGESIGTPHGQVPDDGHPWQPTRQPVVLDTWPVMPLPDTGALTTVMQWDSYPTREYGGQHYGMKAQSFEPYFDLPSLCPNATFEIALGSPEAPRDRLESCGWHLSDPLEATHDPWTYQDFIRRSLGEFSVAKHGYVAANTGWFSERSACYLASGRPVIVQETGFSEHLPTGEGLLTFSTPEQAADCISRVLSDRTGHAAAARQIAESSFDSDTVLTQLLKDMDE